MAAMGRWRSAWVAVCACCVMLVPATSARAGTRIAWLVANGEHGEGSSLSGLIEPLGIVTLVLLATTLTVGLLMKKNRRVLFPLHRTLAFITLASAVFHGLLVLLAH